jgi:hypothetical protein
VCLYVCVFVCLYDCEKECVLVLDYLVKDCLCVVSVHACDFEVCIHLHALNA